jgi:hypothetical protein
MAGCGAIDKSAFPQPARIAIRTLPSPGPDEVCMLAQHGGTLVVEPVSGVGLVDEIGRVTHVVWPYGYALRPDADRLALVDDQDRIAAHVGDRIIIGGGLGRDDVWIACLLEPITVLSTQSP